MAAYPRPVTPFVCLLEVHVHLGESHDLWNVHPMVGALYGRDRLEFEGFVANVGLRADYWFIGREAEQAMADTTRHNIAPSTRTSFFSDTRSFFGRSTLTRTRTTRKAKVKR